MDGFVALRKQVEVLKGPEHRAALERALEAFEGIWTDGVCDAERLAVVVDVAGAAAAAVWSSGIEMLVQLASREEAARAAFVALARSRKAGQRFAALAGIDARLSRPLVLEILAAGLHDKSAKVRAHAFARCNDLGATELVDVMTNVASTLEGKARQEAEWYLALTRDGYLVERRADRAVVTIMDPLGNIFSSTVTLEEAADERIEATIAERRRSAEADYAWGEKIAALNAKAKDSTRAG